MDALQHHFTTLTNRSGTKAPDLNKIDIISPAAAWRQRYSFLARSGDKVLTGFKPALVEKETRQSSF